MFCPICGVEVDKLIEYEGSKVCPKCGCVVEKNEKAAAAVNEITLSKKMSAARIIAVAGIIFSVLSVFIENFSSVEFLLYLLPVILIDVLCIIGYKFKSGKIFNITVVSVLGVFSLLSLVPAVLHLKTWSSQIGLFVDYLLYPKQSGFLVSVYYVPDLIVGICFVLIALFILSRKKAVGSVSVAVITFFGICFLIHDIRCAIIYGQFELSRLYYCSLPCMTMIYSIFLYVLDRMEIEKQGEDESKAAEPAEINQKKIRVVALCTAVIVIAEIGIVIAYKPVKQSLDYKNAFAMFDSGNYDEASSLFEELGDYKDSSEMINEVKYQQAVKYNDSGAYEDALTLFEELGDYKDSSEMINEIKYQQALKHNDSGAYEDAFTLFTELGDYKDSAEYYTQIWQSSFRTIASSSESTVGMKKDGTVVAVGYNGRYDVSGWKDIVSVSAGYYHTVGLKKDGTVVAVGWNDDGQCDVSGWKDIVSVSAGGRHTVGLKKDGTVVAVGWNDYGSQCDVSGWKDIVSVSAGGAHTVGLKKDGTVVAVGINGYGQCDVSGWKDIKTPSFD